MFCIVSACCRYGPLAKKVSDIMSEEGFLQVQESGTSDERTVACFPGWSSKDKLLMLADCIEGTLAKAQIDAREIDFIYFSCTLPMTHLPSGRSIVREVSAQTGLEAPHLHIGGHQCSGVIASIEHASRGMANHPDWRNVLIVTADLVDFSSRRVLGNGVVQGDAASALILSRKHCGLQYMGSLIVSDPSRYEMSGASDHGDWHYFFVLRSLVRALLAGHGLSIDDVACIIPHLSREDAWKRIESMLGYSGELMLKDEMKTTGHLFGSDTVLGIREILSRSPDAHKYILALAYGMGASWGGMLLKAARSSH